jgi:hypothetical protein
MMEGIKIKFKDLIKRESFLTRKIIFSSGVIKLGEAHTKYIRIPKAIAREIESRLNDSLENQDCLVGLKEKEFYFIFYVVFPKENVSKEKVLEEVKSLCLK